MEGIWSGLNLSWNPDLFFGLLFGCVGFSLIFGAAVFCADKVIGRLDKTPPKEGNGKNGDNS